jgi:small subunit ribosomal protein S3e
MASATRVSKKRKFVADGVMFAEINELLGKVRSPSRLPARRAALAPRRTAPPRAARHSPRYRPARQELTDAGFGGIEIRTTPTRTEIVIRAAHTQVRRRPRRAPASPSSPGARVPTASPRALPLFSARLPVQDVLGEKGRRIRELTSVICKRFGFAEGAVELFAERLANRGLSAQAQAESLKYKLLGGLAVRRACYGIIKFVMESGAKGVEVVVAGKLRGQRAKAMKFRDGYMVKTGNSAVVFQDYATRHVMMRQGIMGVRVKVRRTRRERASRRICAPTLPAATRSHFCIIHPHPSSPCLLARADHAPARPRGHHRPQGQARRRGGDSDAEGGRAGEGRRRAVSAAAVRPGLLRGVPLAPSLNKEFAPQNPT